MLIEQIIELESMVLEAPGRTYVPKTSIFATKQKSPRQIFERII